MKFVQGLNPAWKRLAGQADSVRTRPVWREWNNVSKTLERPFSLAYIPLPPGLEIGLDGIVGRGSSDSPGNRYNFKVDYLGLEACASQSNGDRTPHKGCMLYAD